ncbi:MAG: signal recognition particle protein [Pseudomonadota bacterium]|nr:signal recognition particle protein [Pseudomonadota bacterium]
MFESLQERLAGIFDKLTGRGSLAEADVEAALREVRRALIEADVALEVARNFTEQVKEKAVGQAVVRSVTPGQMVVKIVHDALVETLGGDGGGLDLQAAPPVGILMVGLQGSGKTTTTAKIAKRLKERDNRRVLMASLDTRRPAAQEQLQILGRQIGVDTLDIVRGAEPLAIAERAMREARQGGYDVIMLDTAGRQHIDEELMAETRAVRELTSPHEILLVADALTGQDAVRLAQSFNDKIGISGIVLTRIDGDGRGGAALSMRAVTGKPIKLLGTGEQLDGLEEFHAARIAGRILGMGDVVSLVEKATQTIDAEKAQKIAARMKKGQFDLDDLAEQLGQMQKLGGMSSILGMLPGVAKFKKQLEGADLDNKVVKRQLAIISSLTPFERRNPKVMNASRKRRVAKGSGTRVEEINRLLKMHLQMADMMKKMNRNPGLMGRMFGMGGGAAAPDEAEMARMQAELSRLDPNAMPGDLRNLIDRAERDSGGPPMSAIARGLPGLGGGMLPGLGGQPFRGSPGKKR